MLCAIKTVPFQVQAPEATALDPAVRPNIDSVPSQKSAFAGFWEWEKVWNGWSRVLGQAGRAGMEHGCGGSPTPAPKNGNWGLKFASPQVPTAQVSPIFKNSCGFEGKWV